MVKEIVETKQKSIDSEGEMNVLIPFCGFFFSQHASCCWRVSQKFKLTVCL